jgi:hypothetical protein
MMTPYETRGVMCDISLLQRGFIMAASFTGWANVGHLAALLGADICDVRQWARRYMAVVGAPAVSLQQENERFMSWVAGSHDERPPEDLTYQIFRAECMPAALNPARVQQENDPRAFFERRAHRVGVPYQYAVNGARRGAEWDSLERDSLGHKTYRDARGLFE